MGREGRRKVRFLQKSGEDWKPLLCGLQDGQGGLPLCRCALLGQPDVVAQAGGQPWQQLHALQDPVREPIISASCASISRARYPGDSAVR